MVKIPERFCHISASRSADLTWRYLTTLASGEYLSIRAQEFQVLHYPVKHLLGLPDIINLVSAGFYILVGIIPTSAELKYERGEAVPSINFAKRIADAFGVSLDYLVGEGVNASFDKKTLTRLQEIESLQEKDREHVLALLDAFRRDTKTRKAYAA